MGKKNNGSSTTLTLTMIVKNESKNMVRILDSVKNVADNICIVDTGSTDNTIEVIENWCKEHKKPFVIPIEKFIDFSINRTLSVYLAREAFPKTTYFLMLDADMILVVKPEFNKNKLTANGYNMNQVSSSSKYLNMRLLKNIENNDWLCVGTTHEYWATAVKVDYVREICDTMYIDDREDGGCKDDKFIRDERLFKKSITDEGYNEYVKSLEHDSRLKKLHDMYDSEDTRRGLRIRYTYYLGQTLLCLGKYKEAIEVFAKRANMKDTFEEEGWYAQFKKAQCHFNLQNRYADHLNKLRAFKTGDRSEKMVKYIKKYYNEKVTSLIEDEPKEEGPTVAITSDFGEVEKDNSNSNDNKNNSNNGKDKPTTEICDCGDPNCKGKAKTVVDKDLDYYIKKYTKNVEYHKNAGFNEMQIAYTRRPWRIEPVVALAEKYRVLNDHDKNIYGYYGPATHYAIIARNMPYPKNDILFNEYDSYANINNDYEVMLSTYYYGPKVNEGIISAQNIMRAIIKDQVKDFNGWAAKGRIAHFLFNCKCWAQYKENRLMPLYSRALNHFVTICGPEVLTDKIKIDADYVKFIEYKPTVVKGEVVKTIFDEDLAKPEVKRLVPKSKNIKHRK